MSTNIYNHYQPASVPVSSASQMRHHHLHIRHTVYPDPFPQSRRIRAHSPDNTSRGCRERYQSVVRMKHRGDGLDPRGLSWGRSGRPLSNLDHSKSYEYSGVNSMPMYVFMILRLWCLWIKNRTWDTGAVDSTEKGFHEVGTLSMFGQYVRAK